MNEKLKEFIKTTQKQVLLNDAFKITNTIASSLKFTKNLSVHELTHLKLLVLTWNLAGSTPEEKDFFEIFNKDESLFTNDLIVFGTQECSQSIFISFFYNSKSGWEDLLLKKFKGNYLILKTVEMNAMHLIVFIKKQLVNFVEELECEQIPTGFMNFIGNKGAIGIGFRLLGSSFLFMNCHFSAGDSEIANRNLNYEYIENNSSLGNNNNESFTKYYERVSDRFDRVFWLGDLNYRVEVPAESLKSLINERNYMGLLKFDQLQRELLRGTIFIGFEEGPITFNPTYKHSLNSVEYTYSLEDKKNPRIPSWTDRILYKSKEKKAIHQIDYNSLYSPLSSDHRAVFSHFIVSLSRLHRFSP